MKLINVLWIFFNKGCFFSCECNFIFFKYCEMLIMVKVGWELIVFLGNIFLNVVVM